MGTYKLRILGLTRKTQLTDTSRSCEKILQRASELDRPSLKPRKPWVPMLSLQFYQPDFSKGKVLFWGLFRLFPHWLRQRGSDPAVDPRHKTYLLPNSPKWDAQEIIWKSYASQKTIGHPICQKYSIHQVQNWESWIRWCDHLWGSDQKKEYASARAK